MQLSEGREIAEKIATTIRTMQLSAGREIAEKIATTIRTMQLSAGREIAEKIATVSYFYILLSIETRENWY